MKPTFSRVALADFDKIIIDGVYQYGFQQAENYKNAIESLCFRLAQKPTLHAPHKDLSKKRDDLRVYTYKAHSIIYHPTENGIRVVRVVYGSMNWQRDLDKHL